MFKKLLLVGTLALALVLGSGCDSNVYNTYRNVDSDFEQLQDDTLILSGGVDEDTYREFLRYTSDGKKHYTLKIMTNGGCAYNTVAIINRIKLLQQQGVKFTMIVPGHAFSAGSYIFMMGDERIMYPGSMLMWHTMRGQITANGDAYRVKDNRWHLIDSLDQYVVKQFQLRFPHILQEWVDEVFWNTGMTFQTAISAKLMGIATKIMDLEPKIVCKKVVK